MYVWKKERWKENQRKREGNYWMYMTKMKWKKIKKIEMIMEWKRILVYDNDKLITHCNIFVNEKFNSVFCLSIFLF